MVSQPLNNPEKKKEYDQDTYQGVGSFVLEIVKIVVLAFIIIVPIRVFLFQPFFVQGASMEPNFEDGQYLIINEFGYKETKVGSSSHIIFTVNSFKDLQRKQVVVFRYPLDSHKYFIKRIIGLPEEKIQIKNGTVTIFNQKNPDGLLLDEKEYLSSGAKTNGDLTITLGNDEYFVLGDNRSFSSDSRAWGPVPDENIIGAVLFRAWPPNKLEVY